MSESQARNGSLLRASVLMASGTMVSRVLGFIKTAMLLAALGSAGGAVSAAFQTANTLPNTIFNLLASGVFDAVAWFRRLFAHSREMKARFTSTASSHWPERSSSWWLSFRLFLRHFSSSSWRRATVWKFAPSRFLRLLVLAADLLLRAL